MKVRKGTIKRPNFLINYLVSSLIMLIIFTVLGLFVFLPAFFDYQHAVEDLDFDYYNHLVRSISNDRWGEDNTFTEPVSVRIKSYIINYYVVTGRRARYQSDDTGVIDASETAIMWFYTNPDNYEHGILELADKKYIESFKTEEVLSHSFIEDTDDFFFHKPVVNFRCYEFYVDYTNGKFIPVELEIYDNHLEPTGVVLHFTPENTDGYIHVKIDTNNERSNFGCFAGFEGEDPDDAYSIKQEGVDPPYEKTFVGKLEYVSFMTACKDEISWAIFTIIVAAFFVALVPAIISYSIKYRRYEIFEYRRKMIDAMAHDLKTPMAAISAYAENLSNHIGTDKQDYYAGKIEEKVALMNKMVNDMLEFSKSENKSAAITKSDVDLGELLSGIIADNEHAIAERSLKINYDKQSVVIKTDKKLFEQAVSCLINNAVLYSKEGTTIDIAYDTGSLTISNISSEKLENVESLKQAFSKGSLSRGSKGTGLGLAIADNNLAILKYKLDIKSDGEKFIATVKL